jgi:addiction module HigA family antidote
MSISTEKNRPMTMKNPPHPGIVVLQECIEPLGLTIMAAAALGVKRKTLSELVNAKRGISPEMAVRLGHSSIGQKLHATPWSGYKRRV